MHLSGKANAGNGGQRQWLLRPEFFDGLFGGTDPVSGILFRPARARTIDFERRIR
jgi:hypothetical protein